MKSHFLRNLFLTIAIIISITGCSTLHPHSARSIHLNQILAPVKDSLIAETKKPLRFPATVAILAIPGNGNLIPITTLHAAAESLKSDLLKNEKYVNGVSIVSMDDIREKVTLETIRNLYGADIVILVSYQQDQQRIQSSFGAMMNLAIAPVFLAPSVRVTTSTVVDAKIIHIPSNAIILRSNGFDKSTKNLTRYAAEHTHNNDESTISLNRAMNNLGINIRKKLDQLEAFDMSLAISADSLIESNEKPPLATSHEAGKNVSATQRKPTDNWEKIDSYKRSGGGAINVQTIFLIALFGIFFGIFRRRTCHY